MSDTCRTHNVKYQSHARCYRCEADYTVSRVEDMARKLADVEQQYAELLDRARELRDENVTMRAKLEAAGIIPVLFVPKGRHDL